MIFVLRRIFKQKNLEISDHVSLWSILEPQSIGNFIEITLDKYQESICMSKAKIQSSLNFCWAFAGRYILTKEAYSKLRGLSPNKKCDYMAY